MNEMRRSPSQYPAKKKRRKSLDGGRERERKVNKEGGKEEKNEPFFGAAEARPFILGKPSLREMKV